MYGDSPIRQGLTVRELIEMLQDIKEQDQIVVLQYNYGDYHNTQAVRECHHVTVGQLEMSAYSESGWAVPDKEDEDPHKGCDDTCPDDCDGQHPPKEDLEAPPTFVILS